MVYNEMSHIVGTTVYTFILKPMNIGVIFDHLHHLDQVASLVVTVIFALSTMQSEVVSELVVDWCQSQAVV